MPTSNKLATRPFILIEPEVGSVMRLNIFNKVLFPAPLRPMIHTLSPWFISKFISFKAQNSSLLEVEAEVKVEAEVEVEVEGKENSFFALLVITSRKAVYRSCPSWFMI